MVAKSYQSLPMIGQPFQKANNKMYATVVMKSGAHKDVRWYNEEEYYKMYPEDRPEEKLFTNQKKILGFDEGYITIFKGDIEKYEWWFERSIARFHRVWGWYIVSTEMIPFDLPADIEPIQLFWDKVGQSTGELRDEETVAAVVNSMLYGSHPSTFQGNVGDRLELTVTVIKLDQKEKFFGGKSSKNAIHTFEDGCGNHYIWDTGAKCWAEGSIKHIRGSVKEHKIINNVQTTVLTRCMEVLK